jgi:hypothetical protein
VWDYDQIPILVALGEWRLDQQNSVLQLCASGLIRVRVPAANLAGKTTTGALSKPSTMAEILPLKLNVIAVI